GIALADLDPGQLRQTIRVVSEEPLLLAATLRDNLLLGAWGEIDDQAMIDAMRTAGAEEVIEELGGLDGVVGDRGLTVSGGQRQRVSLARALVAHPRVLILDDALSAVHPSLEIEIMRRVHQYLPQTAILFRRTMLAALFLVFLFAIGDIAPSIVFGQVTDAVQTSGGNDASTAYLWALVVVFIAVGVGFVAKYSRIFAQRFNQSVIVVL